MRISTRGRYGLRILLDLAIHHGGSRPRLMREIAVTQSISEKYISRLIIALRGAGLVQSVRGAGGGYMLAKNPQEITLLEVLEVMDEPMELLECLEPGGGGCVRSSKCAARRLWGEVNGKLRDVFASYTLQHLVDIYQSSCSNMMDFVI